MRGIEIPRNIRSICLRLGNMAESPGEGVSAKFQKVVHLLRTAFQCLKPTCRRPLRRWSLLCTRPSPPCWTCAPRPPSRRASSPWRWRTPSLVFVLMLWFLLVSNTLVLGLVLHDFCWCYCLPVVGGLGK